LTQNYPNPFNPSTIISWQSPIAGHQTLRVYDILGNEVVNLVDEYREAGRYEVEFNGHSDEGQNLSSGVYLYHLQSGDFVQTKKMILMK
jgi:flagellar hook assembly protein FlgD